MGNKASSQVAPTSQKTDEPYGPKGERKCRDVLFLLLFVLFWIGMVVVASKAFQLGNPDRLTYPFDSYGNLCGTNNVYEGVVPADLAQDLTAEPFLYWPNPFKPDLMLCLAECPHPTTFISLNLSELICMYNVEPSILKLDSECWPAYDTKPVLNRCVPDLTFNGSAVIAEEAKYRDQAVEIIGDTIKAWKWIALSVAVSVLVSFVAIYLLRLFSGIVVWGVIFCVVGIFLALTVYTNTLSKQMKESLDAQQPDRRLDSDINNQKAVMIISYILIGIDLILILSIVFMRKRIQLAIGIIKESGKAIAAMPSIIVFPIVIFLMLLIFWVYWIVVTAFLGSAGERVYDSVGKFQGYEANKTIRSIGQTTIAGAIASWYWVHDKHDVPMFPVLFSFKRTLRYHLGSLAFGSLIIAIVQFIRAILSYMQKRLHGKENRLLKQEGVYYGMFGVLGLLGIAIVAVFCKATKIAVKGDSFCASAQRAFTLIIANVLRVGATNVISAFLFFLMKLFICIVSTLVGIACMYRDPDLTYWVVPAFLILILSYGVASVFTAVYDMTVDTLLLSFCEDSDRNDGQSKPYFMPDSLRQFLDNNSGKHSCC